MKKILAIILSIAMLFGVLAINTFADATPTVTLVTNEGSPVEKGTSTYFTVRLDNFTDVKGLDVVITADESITLESVDATGLRTDTAKENTNYTKSNDGSVHTIRFVDLTNGQNPKITFKAVVDANSEVTEDPTITVEGKYAKDSKELFKFETPATGSFELKKEIEPDPVVIPDGQESITITQPEAEEGETEPAKFIPYGSVYKLDENDNYVYADKEKDGSFKVTDNDYKVKSFDVPKNGITTFATSEHKNEPNSIRFGSYSKNNKDGAMHGTMIFDGNWVLLKNYYLQRGYTIQQFVEALYKNHDKALKSGTTHVIYNVPDEKGGKVQIKVYKFPQSKHMWKNDDAGVLEYALRLNGVQEGHTYTGIAYSELEGEINISAEVQSITR